LLRADVFRVLDKVFDDHSLDSAWILFPDPWPKKKHHKKRMVQHSLMNMLARKLQIGSSLELRTDHADYKDQMVKVLDATPAFRSEIPGGFATRPPTEQEHIPTLFESKYLERGIAIHYLLRTRVPFDKSPPIREPFPLEQLAGYDPLQSDADNPLPQQDDSE